MDDVEEFGMHQKHKHFDSNNQEVVMVVSKYLLYGPHFVYSFNLLNFFSYFKIYY
jgi:hypothetical protein